MPTVIHAPPLNEVNYLESNLIPEGADLNNYITPGMYYNDSNENAATIANAPASYAFSLLVEKHAGVKQTFTQYFPNNPQTWIRNKYQETWGPWVEQLAFYVGHTEPTGNQVLWIDTSN